MAARIVGFSFFFSQSHEEEKWRLFRISVDTDKVLFCEIDIPSSFRGGEMGVNPGMVPSHKEQI
jgi:hypothetical protein